jgi:thioredoxin reductase (NADPH)
MNETVVQNKDSEYDLEFEHTSVGIIGAGAAGLTAAMVAARYGLKVIIFESKTAGGIAGGIPYIKSYPGLEKVKGTDFIKSLKIQVQNLQNIELHEFEPVKEIKPDSGNIIVITDKNEYIFDNVILAMGADHKHLNVTGEKEFKGRGVSYCAACDGLFFKNKKSVVIGNNTHALEQALFLNELESNVTLINPASTWNAENKIFNDLKSTSIQVLQKVNIDEIYGERMVGGVRVSGEDVFNIKPQHDNSDAMIELEAKGVFISMGYSPRTELIKGLGLELSEDGFVKINENYQTNISNIYAIGNITSADPELVSVCASGANVVRVIIRHLKRK